MLRVLLTGANGQVGYALLERLREHCDLIATTREGIEVDGFQTTSCDLSDVSGLTDLISDSNPQLIINAAAFTQVDQAESEPELAHAINAKAPAALAEAARSMGAAMLHYSTDYVFDGQGKRPYLETDPVAPLGVYGETKLEGERAVMAAHPQALILRTCWVYSWRGSNFLRTMLRHARAGSALRVVDDQQGSPTSAETIAELTSQLLARLIGEQVGTTGTDTTAIQPDASGIYHLACTGHCSWYQFAAEIFAQAQTMGLLEKEPQLSAIASNEYPTPARRPSWSVLDCTRVQEDFRLHLPSWQQALAECLGRLKAQESGPGGGS